MMPSADALLAGLDEQQRVAAEALIGPVCMLAGAGTGKTRAITHRIAYGVATGAYTPNRVMALTFTSRAAAELRGRLRELGASGMRQVGKFIGSLRDFKGTAANIQVQDGACAPAVPAANGEERHGRFFFAGELGEADGGFVLHACQHFGTVG